MLIRRFLKFIFSHPLITSAIVLLIWFNAVVSSLGFLPPPGKSSLGLAYFYIATVLIPLGLVSFWMSLFARLVYRRVNKLIGILIFASWLMIVIWAIALVPSAASQSLTQISSGLLVISTCGWPVWLFYMASRRLLGLTPIVQLLDFDATIPTKAKRFVPISDENKSVLSSATSYIDENSDSIKEWASQNDIETRQAEVHSDQRYEFALSNHTEEYIRRYVEGQLLSTFGYSTSDVDREFPIRMGRQTKRADIVIFRRGKEHVQENIYTIIECKKASDNDIDAARDQVFSYMSACLNAQYAVVASSTWKVWEKTSGYDGYNFREVKQLPSASGEPIGFHYEPLLIDR